MIGYAARTGTRRNLQALRAAGWRLLISAGALRDPNGMRYALDNGAWSAFQQGRPFDAGAFERALERLGEGADWVVLPDIVAGGQRSLDLSLAWRERLAGWPGLLLLAVQDGMTPQQVAPLLGARLGIFVGGSTDWKLATAAAWGELARTAGCHLHVARVNTARRVRLCAAIGATSFDGSSPSRYATTLPLLDHVRRQPDLFAPPPR